MKMLKIKKWQSLLLVPLAAGAFAQESVIIEAGPNGVRIADGDGRLEVGPATSTTTVEVTPQPLVPGPIKPNIGVEGGSALTVRPNGPALTSPTVVNQANVTTGVPTRTFAQPDPVVLQARQRGLEIVDIRRRAELVKDLNILENSVDARIVIRTDNMFDRNTEEIDSIAYPLLGKIAEYLRLSPLNGVDVTYVQDFENISAKQAWARSATLVGWFKTNKVVDNKTFSVSEPEFSVATEKDTNPVEKGGEDFGEYFVLEIK